MRSGSTGDHCDDDRRRLILRAAAGLTVAYGLGDARMAVSASPETSDPQVTPYEFADPEAALLANLVTRMSVRGRVNGAGPYEFVIDTGATRTAISQEMASDLALPEGPLVLVHGVTSAQTARTVHVEKLEVARRRFNHVEPCTFPRADLGADGLLGLDALSGFHLQLDLAGRAVSLTPSGPDRVTFGRLVPSRIGAVRYARSRRGEFGQLILLNAQVEGVQTACFVDSGAQYSIGNPALRTAVNAGQGQGRLTTINPIRVFGVTGQIVEASPGLVTQLEINRLRLGPTRLLFADLHAFKALGLDRGPALLIGADLLSRFSHVSLDFGLSRMNFGRLRRQTQQV